MNRTKDRQEPGTSISAGAKTGGGGRGHPARRRLFQKAETVMGRRFRPPRPTLAAIGFILGPVAGPVLLALLALDLILGLVFIHGLGRCYGISCLLTG
ncbi:hypothetical protein [Yunchengibacter salinarum]|uniref:hypothetical protein n=1 Tax=Yunchengibacter salinarum TaxID=3133399 RepID=UPI0035B654D0